MRSGQGATRLVNSIPPTLPTAATMRSTLSRMATLRAKTRCSRSRSSGDSTASATANTSSQVTVSGTSATRLRGRGCT